jgi:hypothetical protein
MTQWKFVVSFPHASCQGLTITVEQGCLFDKWKALRGSSGEHRMLLERITRTCGSRCCLGPGSGCRLYVRGTSDDIEVYQNPHSDILPFLSQRHFLLWINSDISGVTTIFMTELGYASSAICSMSSQRLLVSFEIKLYVAEDSAENEDVNEVFMKVDVLGSFRKPILLLNRPRV